jgi:peptidylprolyl isomerase
MRRASALVVIPLLAVAAVAGSASSSSASTSSSSTSSSSTANQSVKVSGAFGVSPKVTFPKGEAAGSNLYTKTVIKGTGPKLNSADSLVGNFVLYDWRGKTARLIASTFSSGGSPTLFSDQILPGLSKALLGQRTGSRVIAVIPPRYGFGAAGNPSIGVKGTDTIVFVVDMLSAISNKASAVGKQVSDGGGTLPTVTEPAGKAARIKIPASAAPKTLTVKTLVQGGGAKVVKRDYVVVQYTGVIWRTGKVFDSSWSRDEPFAFNVGEGQVIKGWDDGLLGRKVGSRVMLVIPPADGYGSAGVPGAGIKGTDTLVFVVDILRAYAPAK